MTSISTYGQFQRIQADTLRTQSKLLDLQTQATTGKKGILFGDLGADGRRSLDVRASVERLENYRTNVDLVETRTAVMDTVMTRMGQMVSQLRQEFAKLSGNLSDNTTFLNEIGRRGLDELTSLLNTRIDGRYLFAGNDVSTRPVDPTAVQGTLTTRFSTLIADYRNNTLSGTQVTAQMAQQIDDPARAYSPAPTGFAADPLAAPIFPQSLYYAGSPTKVRVESDYDVEYGLRADQPVFRDLFKVFALASTIRYDATTDQAQDADYRTILSYGEQLSISSGTNLNTEQGRLGVVRQEMKTVKARHGDVLTVLNQEIGQIEDADMAEVFTKVQQKQVALQASFQITASLRDLSLLNYL